METEKSSILSQIALVISLLGYVAFGLFMAYFVLKIIGMIFLGVLFGILMSSGESVAHSVVSPDNQVTALVVSDGCGITCGCTVRVDLRTDDEYIEEIWRGIDVCDATVVWLSNTDLNILADNGHKIRIDVGVYGLSP